MRRGPSSGFFFFDLSESRKKSGSGRLLTLGCLLFGLSRTAGFVEGASGFLT